MWPLRETASSTRAAGTPAAPQLSLSARRSSPHEISTSRSVSAAACGPAASLESTRATGSCTRPRGGQGPRLRMHATSAAASSSSGSSATLRACSRKSRSAEASNAELVPCVDAALHSRTWPRATSARRQRSEQYRAPHEHRQHDADLAAAAAAASGPMRPAASSECKCTGPTKAKHRWQQRTAPRWQSCMGTASCGCSETMVSEAAKNLAATSARPRLRILLITTPDWRGDAIAAGVASAFLAAAMAISWCTLFGAAISITSMSSRSISLRQSVSTDSYPHCDAKASARSLLRAQTAAS